MNCVAEKQAKKILSCDNRSCQIYQIQSLSIQNPLFFPILYESGKLSSISVEWVCVLLNETLQLDRSSQMESTLNSVNETISCNTALCSSPGVSGGRFCLQGITAQQNICSWVRAPGIRAIWVSECDMDNTDGKNICTQTEYTGKHKFYHFIPLPPHWLDGWSAETMST